jgi:type II secretory pathway component PulK
LTALAATAMPLAASAAVKALVAENTQPISGNGWIALGVIGLLVVVIVMLIRGTLHIEERHARMYGPSRDGGHAWFGPVHIDDDGDDGSN